MAEPALALVTGGAGFIGSALVRLLLAEGWHIRVLDNFATGKRANLAGLDARALQVVEGDVRDEAAVRRACAGVHTVFHLACLGLRHSLHAPRENHEVNATGSLIVARSAHAARVSRFVHVSSSEVYGTARHVPMDEAHPCQPTTVYGAAKLAGEAYARALHTTEGLPAVIVRPFNAYGPRCHHEGDAGEVIPKFLLRALAGQPLVVFGDGEQSRDFTAVADTARGLLAAAQTPGAIGQTLNLGAGREIRINALAERVRALVNRPEVRIVHEPPRPGDVRRLIADASRARTLLGFAPSIDLDQGIAELLAWYRSLGVPAETLLADERTRNWEPSAHAVSTEPAR